MFFSLSYVLFAGFCEARVIRQMVLAHSHTMSPKRRYTCILVARLIDCLSLFFLSRCQCVPLSFVDYALERTVPTFMCVSTRMLPSVLTSFEAYVLEERRLVFTCLLCVVVVVFLVSV